MMKTSAGFKIGLLLVFGVTIGTSPAVAEDLVAKNFARICLVVEELASEEGGEVSTSVFDENSHPGPGRSLTLYLDASLDAYALVVAFKRKDQTLVHHWFPRFVKLEAWEEFQLPEESVTWNWESDTEDFEIHILFMTETDTDFDAFKTIVDAMRQSGEDSQLLALQVVRLHEVLDRWVAEREPITFLPGVTPPAWGGTLRGVDLHWRQNSQKLTLDEQGHGYTIYPVPSTSS